MARLPALRRPRGLRLTIAAAMALVGVAALALGHFRPKTDAERLATMGDDVREAVLRDFARDELKDSVVVLSFEGEREAPDAFLARVADLPCRFGKRSSLEMARKKVGRRWMVERLRDRATGAPGVEASIEIVRWVSDTEVEVAVSLMWGPLAGGSYRCRLKRVAGSWHVADKFSTGAA